MEFFPQREIYSKNEYIKKNVRAGSLASSVPVTDIYCDVEQTTQPSDL